MQHAHIRTGDSSLEQPEFSRDDVVRVLEEEILFGRLRPRERLVEDGLIARFKVKRHVVRQALSELERLGIVIKAPNRGAAVRDFTLQEVSEIYELRELLEARAAERMPLPAAANLVEQLTAIQRQHDAAVETQVLRQIEQINNEFHRVFFSACGSRHLADAIAHYFYLSRAMRLYPLADPTLLGMLRDEHWEMIEALKAGDREALVRLCVQHLQPSKQTYLAVRRLLD